MTTDNTSTHTSFIQTFCKKKKLYRPVFICPKSFTVALRGRNGYNQMCTGVVVRVLCNHQRQHLI